MNELIYLLKAFVDKTITCIQNGKTIKTTSSTCSPFPGSSFWAFIVLENPEGDQPKNR